MLLNDWCDSNNLSLNSEKILYSNLALIETLVGLNEPGDRPLEVLGFNY